MTTEADVSVDVPRKIRVRKDGSWRWCCPCCLNWPGQSGFMFMETALDAGLEHADMAHPRVDWDQWMAELS